MPLYLERKKISLYQAQQNILIAQLPIKNGFDIKQVIATYFGLNPIPKPIINELNFVISNEIMLNNRLFDKIKVIKKRKKIPLEINDVNIQCQRVLIDEF
jgi:hypothetical protein